MGSRKCRPFAPRRIDGKAFTWERVGHMVMTYEGFTLEARVKDTIEIVGDVPSV